MQLICIHTKYDIHLGLNTRANTLNHLYTNINTHSHPHPHTHAHIYIRKSKFKAIFFPICKITETAISSLFRGYLKIHKSLVSYNLFAVTWVSELSQWDQSVSWVSELSQWDESASWVSEMSQWDESASWIENYAVKQQLNMCTGQSN